MICTCTGYVNVVANCNHISFSNFQPFNFSVSLIVRNTWSGSLSKAKKGAALTQGWQADRYGRQGNYC